MTAPDMRHNTALWRRVGRFFLDWLKSLGLYAVVVSAGTLLFLVGSSAVGYLAYSDRPGPGWGRGIFSWSEVKFFVGWLPLLIYCLLYLGEHSSHSSSCLAGFARRAGSCVCLEDYSLGSRRLSR